MPKNDFVHLHFHTQYSLLDGACRIKDAVKKASRLGMPGLAITDHGVMFGAIEHYKACKAADIKPIIGSELYTTPHRMTEKKRNVDGSISNHLLLLAKNETGYQNLSRMCSLGHLQGYYYKPRIDKELLAENAQGLIATTTCLKGEIPEMIIRDQFDAAVKRAGEYAELFDKGDYYVELQDHGIKEQKKANQGLIQLAKKLNLPLIATNDVHYLEQEHSKAHEVLLCLQTQTTLNDPGRLKYGSDQFYMKTPDEMAALFGDIPGALSNTIEITEKCNLTLKLGLEADLHFPTYDLPKPFTDDRDFFIHISKKGLSKKYNIGDFDLGNSDLEKQIKERFYYELSVIERTGFLNYFLVVWDFIAWAKTQNIPVGPGRGSGAGSIVAYAMDITDVDPLRYNLIFERFLNPERISPPDFDIDFCQQRRGEVIEYVKEKYGQENCAQIITFGTLGAKMVIRDVARVLEIPLNDADKLAKLIPETPGMTLAKAEKENPDFKKALDEPNARNIMQYARLLEGLPRQQGTHAAGVVIGEKPLTEIIPLCRDKEKQTVTQFEMKPLEETGLLKMDFLGLKTLTVIQETIDNIKETHDIHIDISTLSLQDPKTFDLLNKGDTGAVFQVESKGMKEWLRKFQLAKFEDLIAMIALYRPGPMDMLPDFIARRHKLVEITYDHPLLQPILEETYGVMIYQEQVQQASASLAGFSLGQGDMLRRAMGKKNVEIMAQERKRFVDGCIQTNQINPKLAGKIFDNIEKFAGYGFNKSHSTAYAFISWQTAYLKAHYPVEFMAAVCSCDMGNPDKLANFIDAAQKMDIQVLPPSVNAGGQRFKPEGQAIRFGMAGIKGVGSEAVAGYVKERQTNGPFAGLTDFCMRLDSTVANKRVLEALIKCGAFDWAHMYRSTLFHHLEFAMQRAAATQKDLATGQTSMFDILSETPKNEQGATKDDFPKQPAWPNSEMLRHEKELIGFYITGHPLDEYQWQAEHLTQAPLTQFDTLEKGSQIRLIGLVTQTRKLFTKKTQEPMAAFSLEGKQGAIDCVMFPSSYQDFGRHIIEANPIVIIGEIAQDEDGKLFASEAYPLSDANKIFIDKLTLHLDADTFDEQQIQQTKNILSEHPGQTPVIINMSFPSGHNVRMSTDENLRTEITAPLIEALHHRLTPDRVQVDIATKPGKREQKKRTWGHAN